MFTLIVAAGLLLQDADKDAVEQFWKDYKSTPSETTRAAIVRTLAKTKGDKVTNALLTLLSSGGDEVRKSAAAGLATRHEERAVQGLVGALNQNKDIPEVRVAIIEALGALGMDAAVKPLIGLLDQYKNGVAAAAAASLGKIGSPDAFPDLLKLLEKAEKESKSSGNVYTNGGYYNSRNDALAQLRKPVMDAMKAISREKFTTPKDWEGWWARHKGALKLDVVYCCPTDDKVWKQAAGSARACPSSHKNCGLRLGQRIRE